MDAEPSATAVELRDIEIPLTPAEESHFGRTADRLHVSQARVSQSIAKQERQIGARLFTRSSRRVELTPIGVQLCQDLRAGYQRVRDGTRAAAAAAGRCPENAEPRPSRPQPQDRAHFLGLFRTPGTPRSKSTSRR